MAEAKGTLGQTFRPISQSEVRKRFDYDPATGDLIWRHTQDRDACWNRRFAGKIAGYTFSTRGKRYARVGLGKDRVAAHRIIWAWHYGDVPTNMEIDHIDGNGLNNRIENLRLATRAENLRNVRRTTNNTTGATGVYWVKEKGLYRAIGRIDGKQRHLGSSKDFEKAVRIRKQWERENGYHPNHGTDRPL